MRSVAVALALGCLAHGQELDAATAAVATAGQAVQAVTLASAADVDAGASQKKTVVAAETLRSVEATEGHAGEEADDEDDAEAVEGVVDVEEEGGEEEGENGFEDDDDGEMDDEEGEEDFDDGDEMDDEGGDEDVDRGDEKDDDGGDEDDGGDGWSDYFRDDRQSAKTKKTKKTETASKVEKTDAKTETKKDKAPSYSSYGPGTHQKQVQKDSAPVYPDPSMAHNGGAVKKTTQKATSKKGYDGHLPDYNVLGQKKKAQSAQKADGGKQQTHYYEKLFGGTGAQKQASSDKANTKKTSAKVETKKVAKKAAKKDNKYGMSSREFLSKKAEKDLLDSSNDGGDYDLEKEAMQIPKDARVSPGEKKLMDKYGKGWSLAGLEAELTASMKAAAGEDGNHTGDGSVDEYDGFQTADEEEQKRKRNDDQTLALADKVVHGFLQKTERV